MEPATSILPTSFIPAEKLVEVIKRDLSSNSGYLHLCRLLSHLRDLRELDPRRLNAPHRQILCTDQNDTLAANQDSFAETRREFNLSDETLAKMMKRRNCIAEEFLSTERTYLKELLSLEELYMTPLEAAKEILNKDDLLLLFANLKDIIKVHKMQLLPLIQAAVSHSDQPLGSALCKVLPLLKICRVN